MLLVVWEPVQPRVDRLLLCALGTKESREFRLLEEGWEG
jgi:hypothetical protein